MSYEKVVVKFLNAEVNCEEFGCYILSIDERMVCEVSLLIDINIGIIEEIYSDPFLIITPHNSYVFSGYRLEEYFDEDGLTRIICRK